MIIPILRIPASISLFTRRRAVPTEIPEAPDRNMAGYISRILKRAGSIQGRIANRCHVQVPLGYTQHKLWEERFRAWWTQGFKEIIHYVRESDLNYAIFCTELGPPPYAWTNQDDVEVSDRWAEALIIQGWAREAFQSAVTSVNQSQPSLS